MEEALFYKEADYIIYIRAQGHITANTCSDLKSRVFERLDMKPPINNIFVDLKDCEYMDSTFMGLLVGFNKRFLRFSERAITILHANEACQKLLKTIGVIKLVVLSEDNLPFPAIMENINTSRKAEAQLILNAHEDLIELSEENEKRFSALRTILKKTVDEEKKDS